MSQEEHKSHAPESVACYVLSVSDSRAPGRHQIYTVRIVDGQAMPAFKASGDITSMSQADGYIEKFRRRPTWSTWGLSST